MAQRKQTLYEEQDLLGQYLSRPAQEIELSEVFGELTRKLRQKYNINRGVLVLRRNGESLSAVSTWRNGDLRDGLSLRLPTEASLFEQVAEDGRIYSENFTGSFGGNFFEEKLLIDEYSRSFVIHPLKHEGEVVGLLGYSSERETAFTMFEEGVLTEIAVNFAGLIHRKLSFS